MSGKAFTVRKISAGLLAIALLLCALPILISSPARAEEPTYTAFTKPSKEVDYELLYKNSFVLDDFSDVEIWESGETVKSVTKSTYSGGTACLLATADGDRRRSLSVSRELYTDEGYDVPTDGYRELSFSFLALGATDLSYDLNITLSSGERELVYTAKLTPNDWQDVFLDLSELGGASLSAISVTVTGTSPEAYVTSAALSSLALGDVSHSDLALRYSALYIYGGEITNNAIKVTPKEQSALVRAEALIPHSAGSLESTVMITLTLRGVGYSQMTVSTSEAPAWRASEYSEMTSLTVTSETDTYVCCFSAKGKITSWALSFAGVSTVGSDSFYIEKVSITLGGDTAAEESLANESLGKVTKCAFSGTDSVQIAGSVSHSAAVEYIDGQLGLFMIPGWQTTKSALEGDPILTSGVSTEFVFKVPLDAFPTASGCRFAVALMKDGERAVIADMLWPIMSSTFVQTELPKLIVSAEHDDDVFSYGAQAVAIDVNLSKLFKPANDSGTRLIIWGDSFFYFSQSLLSSITAKTDFYTACGMKYYFRLICSTDKFAVASGIAAESYAIDVSDRLNYEMTAALVSFLSDRYSPVGYILGESLNVSDKNASLRFADMFSLMKQTADSARLIYSIASQKNPYTVVILPFKAVTEIPAAVNSNTRITPAIHSAVSCAALADLYISAQGDAPVKWAALVYADDKTVRDVPSQAATNHASGYLGTAIAPTDSADSSDSAATYPELLREFPYALFYALSLGDEVSETLERQALAPEVRTMPHGGDSFTGSIYLWDFRRSFSTDKWVRSGSASLTTGVSTPLTEVGELLSCRALRLDLRDDSAHDGASVIAASALPASLELSDCSYVEFRFAAFSDYGDAAFEIHLGDASGRWFYPVSVPGGGAYSVLCRLPDGVIPTYFAISAKAADGVTVELGEVLAHSVTITSEELASKASQNEANQKAKEQSSSERLFQIAVAVLSGASIAIFTVLNRLHKQKSDSE